MCYTFIRLFFILCAFVPLCLFASSWQIQTIDNSLDDVGLYSSIACDSLGRAHISYTNLTTGGLKYTYFNGSTWTTNNVGTTGSSGYYPSIDLDSNNCPHISHYNATYQRLLHTKGVGTASSIVDFPQLGKFSSLKIDIEQYPNISYYDEKNKALKYAFWTGSEWATETVDYALNKDRGRFSSLFLVEDSLPCMTYYDATDGDLRFAFRNTANWGFRTIDTTGDVGQYSSLTGKDYILHIAYYDATNTDLKYAINPEGTWTLRTIDSIGDVGKFCSIAIDGSNTVWISYYDATNKDLKVAYGSGTSWATETIDSTDDVGMYSSIAIYNNIPQISYYDATQGNLKYATLGTATPPNPPSNLQATAVSSSTINLGWSDNSTNELWFIMERGTTDTSLFNIGTTTYATYTDTSLSSNTIYYYRVYAYNFYGTSSYSNIASATTFDLAPIA
ncbi:MAG: fibronectin type III domain-containing protein, partial [bacterium]